MLRHHPPTVAHNMSWLRALEYIYFYIIIVYLDRHATYSRYWKYCEIKWGHEMVVHISVSSIHLTFLKKL